MRILLIKLGAGLLALAVLGVWAAPRLRPLAQLIPNTRAMATTTREILKETEGLQQGVLQVQTNLSQVRRQDQLLAEQQQLMNAAVAELLEQERLAGQARTQLSLTLAKEEQAAVLTARAAERAAAITGTVTANARELNLLSAATGRIQSGSNTIDGQMDRMLDELNQSATNFAVVARFKEAFVRAVQRFGRWW